MESTQFLSDSIRLRRVVLPPSPSGLHDSRIAGRQAARAGWERWVPGEYLSVPQLGTLVLEHNVDDLVAFAAAASLLNPKIQREGVVHRPLAEKFDEDFRGRLSFKVINPRFLLKYDD